MKLKQIVFNSLQRPRSKQKKKQHQEQQQQQQQQHQQQQQQQTTSSQLPRTFAARLRNHVSSRVCDPLREEEGHVNSDTANGNAASPKANSSGSCSGSGGGSSRPTTTHSLRTRPALPPGTLNINNINKDGSCSSAYTTPSPITPSPTTSTALDGTKCACYKHLNPLESSDGSCRKEGGYSSAVSSAEDSGFISLPKTRTLIKTNPWLPSPRSTSGSSPDVSPTSSSSPSPIYADRHPFPRCSPGASPPERSSTYSGTQTKRKKKRRSDGRMSSSEPVPMLNIPVNPCPALYANLNCVTGSDSVQSSDGSEWVPRRSESLSESDNGGIATVKRPVVQQQQVLPEKEAKCSSPNLHDIIDEQTALPELADVSHCIPISSSTQTSCSDLNELPPPTESNEPLGATISFEYEEAFESQLEAKSIGQYVDSRDNLSDDSGDHLFVDPLGSRAHDFDSEYCPSVYDSSPATDYDSETETDDTVCDDYYTATGFRGHGRPGPFNDLFRDYYKFDCSDGNDSDAENSDIGDDAANWSNNNHAPHPHQRLDSRGTSPELLMDSNENMGIVRPSAVNQMRLSLAQKVNRLRREKRIVDEKVAEAQEAEQLRLQERRRMRKEVNMHRKRLLLRTLQDLRSKLEEQSARLQQTYSAVLYMQQSVIKERRKRAPWRRPAPPPVDIREAPF